MLNKDLIILDKLLKYRNPKQDVVNNINNIKKIYNDKLIDYEYIETLQDFSLLSKGGSIKSISLNNEMINGSGIVIKIDKDIINRWYALLGVIYKKNNIKYIKNISKIYFDNNYIFYKSPNQINMSNKKTNFMKHYLNKFLTQEEIEKYKNELKK